MKFRFDGRLGESICSGLADLEIENRVADGILKNGKDHITKAVRIKKVKDGNLVAFNKYELDSINRWLFKSNYKALEIGRYVYYAIFFKENRWIKYVDKGYIDLRIRLKPYAYSNKMFNSFMVIGEKISTIYNRGNYEEDTIVEVKLCDNIATRISIQNITTNKVTEFSNLIQNEHIYIDGSNDYITSKIDNKRDLYKKFNGIYLKLAKGVNEIKFISDGRIKVAICHQSKIDLGEVWLNE